MCSDERPEIARFLEFVDEHLEAARTPRDEFRRGWVAALHNVRNRILELDAALRASQEGRAELFVKCVDCNGTGYTTDGEEEDNCGACRCTGFVPYKASAPSEGVPRVYPCGGPSDRSAGGCGGTLTEAEVKRGTGFCVQCRPEIVRATAPEPAE